MERIGQVDVITILERLHQELKAQTRESKVDQHYLLRKSFHYVTATLYKPSQLAHRSSAQGKKLGEVTHRVLQELFALLVGGDGFAPPRIRILSSALVRELSAGDTPYFFRDNFGGNFSQYDQNKVKYFLPVLSELSNSKLLVQNISNLVMWFVGEHEQLGLKTSALSNLIALVQRFPNVLDKEKHIRPMEAKFEQLLIGASLETRKTTSTTLFGMRIVSTSSSCNVTEIDGAPSRDFFTCMNNSYDYSEDQILNVHIFSSLYYWIFHLYQAQLLEARRKQSREDIVSKLEHFGLADDCVASHLGDRRAEMEEEQRASSSRATGDEGGGGGGGGGGASAAWMPQALPAQRLSPIGCFTLDDSFREVVISMCLRVLSQVERDIVMENVSQMRLGSKYIVSDHDWIKEFTEATSMEAVRILDLLCLMDPSLVSCIFPAVKKVYERTANRQSGLVFSAVLQFFVNHGQHVIFDVDPVLHHFFVDYVSVRYRRQLLAMSTLLFLTTNTSKMLLHTSVFSMYYPAIIKLLAWHPRTVASAILPIVPAMVGPNTFSELFHTLLDLPLTAAFMEQYDRPDEHAESQWSRYGLDRMSPVFKTVQQYIMRNEAGHGGACIWEARDETQLAIIRILWNSLPVTPRVSSVCKLVPRFLRVYFDVLLTNAPPQCIERVVPLLLQRFASLYPVDFFLNAVHSLIIDTLQAIFQQWPGFLMTLKTEVVHAISMHLDVQGRLLVLHLCWIIGELLSPSMCGDCKGDVAVFFEALEMLAYEVISDRSEDPVDKKRRTLRGLQGGTKCDPDVPNSAVGAAAGHDHTKNAVEGAAPSEGGWHDEPQSVGAEHHHEEVGGGIGGTGGRPGEGSGEEELQEAAAPQKPDKEYAGEPVFTPRFIAVIIASLTKLGTKFPEFSPRVVLCLLKMRQHYETDFSEGIEFVRDRLTDSLQILRHSAIANSIFTSQKLPGAEPDRFFSFHLSALSSLSHFSHNPSTFTPGALLHDFELPSQPPMAQVANIEPADRWRGDPYPRDPAGVCCAGIGEATSEAAFLTEAVRGGGLEMHTSMQEQTLADTGDNARARNLDRFAELRRAAAVAIQNGGRPAATATATMQSTVPGRRFLSAADVEGCAWLPPVSGAASIPVAALPQLAEGPPAQPGAVPSLQGALTEPSTLSSAAVAAASAAASVLSLAPQSSPVQGGIVAAPPREGICAVGDSSYGGGGQCGPADESIDAIVGGTVTSLAGPDQESLPSDVSCLVHKENTDSDSALPVSRIGGTACTSLHVKGESVCHTESLGNATLGKHTTSEPLTPRIARGASTLAAKSPSLVSNLDETITAQVSPLVTQTSWEPSSVHSLGRSRGDTAPRDMATRSIASSSSEGSRDGGSRLRPSVDSGIPNDAPGDAARSMPTATAPADYDTATQDSPASSGLSTPCVQSQAVLDLVRPTPSLELQQEGFLAALPAVVDTEDDSGRLGPSFQTWLQTTGTSFSGPGTTFPSRVSDDAPAFASVLGINPPARQVVDPDSTGVSSAADAAAQGVSAPAAAPPPQATLAAVSSLEATAEDDAVDECF